MRGFPIKIWLQSDLTKVPLVIGSNCQTQTSANTKMGQLSSFYLNSNHTISLSQMLCLNQSTRDRMWLKRFQGTSIHRRTLPPTICSAFLLILSNLQGITPLNKEKRSARTRHQRPKKFQAKIMHCCPTTGRPVNHTTHHPGRQPIKSRM